jgi:hypothetical protein
MSQTDENLAIANYEARKKAQKRYNASEKGKVARKTYLSSAGAKERQKQAMTKYQQLNPKGKASNILQKMKHNSKKRGHEWSDSWWSVEQIENIIINGKCEQSGLPFQLRVNTEKQKNNRNPFAPSPDRKDLTKGYEPSNVQWVLWIFNVMKNTFDDVDVEIFLKAMKNKQRGTL